MSVTHPVHLTRLQIPNIVWWVIVCVWVNFYFYFPQEFLPAISLLEDPDKKWQIHFCAVDHDATFGRRSRVVETADAAALPRILVYYPSAWGGVELARRGRQF